LICKHDNVCLYKKLNVFLGPQAQIQIDVYDFDADGKHDLIGSVTGPLGDLTRNLNRELQLIDGKKFVFSVENRSVWLYLTMIRKKAGKFVISRVEQEQKVRPAAYSITFAAEKLTSMDGLFGKSDPFLVIESCPPNGKSCVFMKTEVIKNDLNPIWKPVEVSAMLCGSYDAPILLRVYDYDADGTHDFIGETKSTLRQLISSSPKLVLINAARKNQSGYVNSGCLMVKQVAPTQPTADIAPQRVCLGIKCERLSSKDTFSKSDPFLQVRNHADMVIYKSKHFNNEPNPVFPPFELNVSDCLGMDGELKFELYDYDDNTRDDLIGTCEMSLRHVSLYHKNPVWRVIDPKKRKNSGYKNSGFLIITRYEPVQGQVHNAGPQGGFGGPQQGMPMQGQPGGFGGPQQGMPMQGGYGGPQGQQGGYGGPQQGMQRDFGQSGMQVQPGFGAQGFGGPQPAYEQQPGMQGQPGYGGPQGGYGGPQQGMPMQGQPGGFGGPQQGMPMQGGYGGPQGQQGGYGVPPHNPNPQNPPSGGGGSLYSF